MKIFTMAIVVLACGLGGKVSAETVFKGSARFKIKPAHVAEFKEAVQEIIRPTLREKGCLEYEAYQVVNSGGSLTNEFEFHEIWRSRDDMMIDHKEKAPHMIRFFSKIRIGKSDSWVEAFQVHGSDVQAMNPGR